MASSIRSEQKMSEETFDFPCTTCAEDNKTIEGVKYCVECSGYFCLPCTDAHNKFPLMKSHNVMDVDQIGTASGQQKTTLEFPTERCNVHKGKVLDMYCGDHAMVGCYVCIAKDHKTCDDRHIHSVPDMIDTLYKLSGCKQIHGLLKDKIISLEVISKSKDTRLQALVTAKEDALVKVNASETALVALIRKAAENSRNQVETTYKEIETEILNEKQAVDSMRDDLQAADDKLEKSKGNRAQQFVCAKMAKEKIKEANGEKIKQDLPANLTDVPFSFIPDQSLLKGIKSRQGIGHVKKHKQQKHDLYSIKEGRDINIKRSDDSKVCSSAGCCLTPGGHLLVADYANNKLKRFDLQSMSFVDSCTLKTQPFGVCCISKDEVAVACTKKQIQFVSTLNKMAPIRRLDLSHFCYGICFNGDKLFVTDNENALFVHDMNGTVLKTISVDHSGDKLFNSSMHVAFNENGNRLFVAYGVKGVVCFDDMGNHQTTIQDINIKGTIDVWADKHGNMFVVGNLSNTVVQFSDNGKKIGVVVKEEDGLKWPQSVCFHQESNRMFITMKNSDVVKVLYLK